MRNDTKIERRSRGRPRGFDARVAGERILATFWTQGFAATSLEQLAAATGLNRPSLYAAFGDKKAMYRQALAGFAESMRAEVGAALAEPTLRAALRRFYRGAIKLYLSGEEGPRGCLYVCTAAVDAVLDADIRGDIAGVLRGIDAALAARVQQAADAGEIATDSDAAALGMLAGAVLHSLAVRARAGYSRRQLETLADRAIALIAGPAAAA